MKQGRFTKFEAHTAELRRRFDAVLADRMADIRRVKEHELAKLGPETVLVDVREPGEFAAERLPESLNLPLSMLAEKAAFLAKSALLVVVCRSGRRSAQAARKLADMGFTNVYVLDGGLQCCAGVSRGPGRMWAMERQVRMAAGSLVLLGLVLGRFVHPAGWLLSAAIGAGLVYSAATDTCGMALVLARMPWNRAG